MESRAPLLLLLAHKFGFLHQAVSTRKALEIQTVRMLNKIRPGVQIRV